jgi:hypothetical protein
MSSRTSDSVSEQQAENDPAFQIAPAEGDGPNMGALLTAFQRTMSDAQPFIDQCRQNYETRFAIWNGQAADGKKHARESGGKIDPTPWDGSSDLRVFLVDEAINFKVARNGLALRKANLVAVPVNGADITRARVVSNFMKWLVNTQIPELDREEELLSNYLEEKGIAATGQFWEVCQEKTLVTLRIEQLQQQFPQLDLTTLADDKDMLGHFQALIEEVYGTSAKKSKQVMRDLLDKGEASLPVVGRRYSRPVIRAFCLDRDLFIPSWATDIETTPYLFRVEYFSAEQLRAFVNTDGWNKDWVDAAIQKCRGQMITSIPDTTMQPISRSFIYIDRKMPYTDLIGVVYGYQRLSDEDGVPGIYLTIFNPYLKEGSGQSGCAKFGLLGYAHGQYPFTLHRREHLSRKVHDTRGVPEPGKSWQDQIKAHRDSRIDAASLAILPPFAYPLGRPPTRWGPGARVPERRPGEYHFLDKPTGDVNTETSEDRLMRSYNNYNGVSGEGSDPLMTNTLNQYHVEKFLMGWCKAYRQVWKLYQQYGDEEVYFRVIGLQKTEPQKFEKGDPTEDYDIYMSWDIFSMSPEQQTMKLENIAKICATADKYGQVDYSQLLQILLESVDPNIAERIILPKDAAAERFVNEEKQALSQIYSGFDEDIKEGSPPQMGIQVMQQYMQAPDVQQRYQTDEAFKGRMDKRFKQYQFQITQQQNAQIGRLGA